jgi:osmoprotectant transport system ATP-binding protein
MLRCYPPGVPVEYRAFTVTRRLSNVTLTISDGERVIYLGRSGAGKTTALKAINGLVQPTAGDLLVDGTSIAQHDLVQLRRGIGYVMQQPALFPHRTVYENVATVPRLLNWPEERSRAEAGALLDQLGLRSFENRYPRVLSGGEQQRVAIARALIAKPRLLLCDEPFSALDPIIRNELQTLLVETTRDTTLVFVTHDLREANRIADRIVFFDAGQVVADCAAAALEMQQHPLVRRFREAAF